jgi:hypothetical protein
LLRSSRRCWFAALQRWIHQAALHEALLIIPYYAETNPEFVALAQGTVEQVLADIV